MLRLSLFTLLCSLFFAQSVSGQEQALTVQKIMQDPDTWIGALPGNLFWTEDASTLYFYWNPQGVFPSDSLYKIVLPDLEPVKVSPNERRDLPPSFNGWRHADHMYDANQQRKIYSEDGDLYLYNRSTKTKTRLTRTSDRESNPRFTPDGTSIIYRKANTLFKLNLTSGLIENLTDLRSGNEPSDKKPDEQQAFLEEQQSFLFEYIRQQQDKEKQRQAAREIEEKADTPPPAFYAGSKRISQLQIDPTERFVSFILAEPGSGDRTTLVQDYVTESGYAEDRTARAKVGRPDTNQELMVQDLQQDTTYSIDLHQLPGSYDLPAYKLEQGVEVDSSKSKRNLYITDLSWSGNGAHAVVRVRATDNKDRWIARLDPASGKLELLDRQRDEAWIAGPGIGWSGGGLSNGWLPDNRHYYFQSEKTGYSHLYLADVQSGQTMQLTDGAFEIFNPRLSKDGKTWFFTSSEGSPFERHFYRMPVMGGTRVRLTDMPGNNQVAMAPDEMTMAFLHSYSNRPTELFLRKAREDAQQITHSTTDAWRAYAWREPEIIHVEASDGVQVPARLYAPEKSNGAAVLFVHGAGYLQNVHRWWSSYYREYMFHNLLTDKGYTVLDVDYRGSAGYGRDWRTAIYRHMGGRDLQDFVDASGYLNETHGIDPERVFIYGGSYGGFITLMALFTEPEHFGGGAALRSVTDWAHYNHPYTANILNTPAEDSLAFARSSPIYFAEGLQDPLLIAHGMVDTNVQFQDVVRLAQRLIELGKTGWEMAVYPIEGHGFTEPASWTDEYRRILELIEETVGPDGE